MKIRPDDVSAAHQLDGEIRVRFGYGAESFAFDLDYEQASDLVVDLIHEWRAAKQFLQSIGQVKTDA